MTTTLLTEKEEEKVVHVVCTTKDKQQTNDKDVRKKKKLQPHFFDKFHLMETIIIMTQEGKMTFCLPTPLF